MNQLKRKFSALLLIVALVFTLIPATQAEAATKAHNYSGADYVLSVGKTKKLSGYSSATTWSSDNNSVATVDSNGVVKAKKAGVAVITATSQYGLSMNYEIGVKSKNYYPCYNGRYKVGKDIPAGQYVIIYDSKITSNFVYWATYKSKKGSLVNNGGSSYTCFVTLKKGQYVDFNGGYAVPAKKASKSLFKVAKLNKIKGEYGANVKVGYGFPAGTYKFTKQNKKSYGYVYVSKKDGGIATKDDYIFSKYLSSSSKSVTVTLKKGQYVEFENCSVKKVK